MSLRNILFLLPWFCVPISGCLTPSERDKVELWLSCEDQCTNERAVVVNLPASWRAIPTLADALEGLPPARSENIRRRFAAAYNRVEDPAIARDEYVSFFLDNYAAVRQKRAAVSLGDIGTRRALAKLRDALREDSLGNRTYRADVLRTMNAVVAYADEEPFDGQVTPGVPFLGRAIVREGSEDFDGDEAVNLRGGPFPEDLLVARWSDSLSFLAVGEAGFYALSVMNLGVDDHSRVDSFVISSFRYEPHNPATAENVADGPLPLRAYLVLTADSADDYYRFETSEDVDVTVVADWPGAEQIAVAFDTCSIFSGAGDWIAGTVLDENGDPLESVEVTAPSVAVSTFTNQRGGFALYGLPTGPPAPMLDLEFTVASHLPGYARAQVGTAGLLVTLVPAGAPTAEYASPDTSRVTVPGFACYTIRVHRFDRQPDPAILRLRVLGYIPDITAPQFGPLTPPPVGSLGTSAPEIAMSIGGTITDRNVIRSAEVSLYVDGVSANGTGADGSCDPNSDHFLSVPAEIDRNAVEIHNGGNAVSFNESFTVQRPPNPANPVTYCFVITAEDDAKDSVGAPAPNSSTLTAQANVIWN